MKEYPWGKGTVNLVYDSTANDSDKSFTVPVGKVWQLLWVRYRISTTATVGNRIMAVYITNGVNNIASGTVSAVIAASKVGVGMYGFGVGLGTTSMNADVSTEGPLPLMYLPAGTVIRIYDIAAMDATGDDLEVTLNYVEYDA